MDFNFYRNFVVVAETGNISAAAKRLNLVQPALSAQMKTLESYYGIQLFKMQRGKRHIELTEAGEAFLQQARQLCSTEDDISLRMQAFSQRACGTLRFGVSHVRAEYFLRTYLIPFAQKHPEISYQFHDATVEQQQQQLQEESIDFAFANAPLPAAHSFATICVQQENFYVFYNKSLAGRLPFGQRQELSTAELANLPLCCNYGSYALLRSACKACGIKPNVIFIATTAESALSFATSGLGIAACAALPDDPVPDAMLRLPLNDSKLHFDQTLYWSREHRLSPAAELFLEFFRKVRE